MRMIVRSGLAQCLWIAQDFASQGGAAELCGQVSGGRLYDGSLTDDAADVASLLPANTGLWSGFSFVGGIVVYSSNGQPAPLTADCPSDSDCEGCESKRLLTPPCVR
jgi:hypothetical protein